MNGRRMSIRTNYEGRLPWVVGIDARHRFVTKEPRERSIDTDIDWGMIMSAWIRTAIRS